MSRDESTRAYPLYWPESWPRTESHKVKRAQFKDRSVFTARRELEAEVRKFGANLELKLGGFAHSEVKNE